MSKLSNSEIITMVKEITITYAANCGHIPFKETGLKTADFMQAVYDKIVELNQKAD